MKIDKHEKISYNVIIYTKRVHLASFNSLLLMKIKLFMLNVYKSYNIAFILWALFVLLDTLLDAYTECFLMYLDYVMLIYKLLLILFGIQASIIILFAMLFAKDKIINDNSGAGTFGSTAIQPIVIPLYFLMLVSLSKLIILSTKTDFNIAMLMIWGSIFLGSGYYWLKNKSNAKKTWELKGTVIICIYTLVMIFYKDLEPFFKSILDISGCIVSKIKAS